MFYICWYLTSVRFNSLVVAFCRCRLDVFSQNWRWTSKMNPFCREMKRLQWSCSGSNFDFGVSFFHSLLSSICFITFLEGNMFHSNIWEFVVTTTSDRKSNDMSASTFLGKPHIQQLFLTYYLYAPKKPLKTHHAHKYHVINQYFSIYSWNLGNLLSILNLI